MALYRPTNRCFYCEKEIKFIYNKPSKAQEVTGFIGDLGGDYEKHNCKEADEYWDGFKERMAKNITAEDRKAIKDLLNT